MKAFGFRAVLAWAAVGLALVHVGLSPSRSERPNVLLVTIDTLRADHCSAYGYPVPTTPVLDRLARSGTLFLTAYAPSATTAPSHASLLTGRHFRSLGVLKNGHVLSEDARTLAEILREHGYDTAAFVSSFPLRARFGFGQGFDHFDEEFTLEEASLGRRRGEQAHDRLAEATVRRVRAWLDAHHPRRPVFAWVHFIDPHHPYRAPERFAARWPRGTERRVRRYDAEVRYADKNLGRLVRAMERIEGRAGTLIVVTSDHGEGLGGHGWKFHGVNLYEEAVRVPLVVRWRGRIEEGRTVAEPVSVLDIPPTILDLVGSSAALPPDGRNLLAASDPDRAIFLQRREFRSAFFRGVPVSAEMTAVVHDGAKYIAVPEEGRRELYNLTEDPRELNDRMAAQPTLGVVDVALNAGYADADLFADERDTDDRSIPTVAQWLDEALSAWRKANPAPRDQKPLDKQTREALRALGYLD
jgi:choline-sulfatase